jgi:protein TonB
MNENKKTYIIAGSILLLAYIVQRKRTYPTETNIFNLLFGGILYPMYPPPPPPPPPPPTPVEPPTEQQEALNNPMKVPSIKPEAPAMARPVRPSVPKSTGPNVQAAPMPQVKAMKPSFGQYGGKKL